MVPPFEFEFTFLEPSEIVQVIRTATGKEAPIIPWVHFLLGSLVDPSRFRRLSLELYKNTLVDRSRPRKANSYFRPSTGVMAACYALSLHGANVELKFSGFQFEKRDHHVNGLAYTETEGWYRNHVEADRIILRILESNFTVVVD